jgi:hypothetical protein
VPAPEEEAKQRMTTPLNGAPVRGANTALFAGFGHEKIAALERSPEDGARVALRGRCSSSPGPRRPGQCKTRTDPPGYRLASRGRGSGRSGLCGQPAPRFSGGSLAPARSGDYEHTKQVRHREFHGLAVGRKYWGSVNETRGRAASPCLGASLRPSRRPLVGAGRPFFRDFRSKGVKGGRGVGSRVHCCPKGQGPRTPRLFPCK